jgi:8-oxo-dGTP diphosphatase
MTVRVVGAALVRDGRVLAARRSQPSRLAGGWEFPGGKVEPGESDEQALARELHEELGIIGEIGVRLAETSDGSLLLVLYAATLSTGEPHPLEDHDELRWLTARELDDVAWLPIDQALLPTVAALLGG